MRQLSSCVKAAQEHKICDALRLRVDLELMNFDSWAEVVEFLASAHAQGQGTPPLHSDWPKVSGISHQNELYEYS